ncbi:hypothetical protein D3C77_299380 [compost metagenome]
MLAGIGIRHPAHALAAIGYMRQARQAKMRRWPPGRTPQVGAPLAIEKHLPVGHQRPLHLHHHLVPFADCLVRHPELVGNAGTADHRPALVDHQQFAVVTVQVAKSPAPAQTVVPAQFDASGDQALAQVQGERQRTVVIEQAAHLHTAPGGLHQRLDHGFGAGAGLHQVQLQVDLLFGPHNGGEHARKKFGAVDQ